MILNVYSVLGWAGAVLIILAYIFLLTKKLKKDYVLYHLLNFFGAAGLILSTFTTESWPALALSLILAAISVGYIIKILSVKPSYKELRVE